MVDSFPGRMDWPNGMPLENRADGWIVVLNSAENAPVADVSVREYLRRQGLTWLIST